MHQLHQISLEELLSLSDEVEASNSVPNPSDTWVFKYFNSPDKLENSKYGGKFQIVLVGDKKPYPGLAVFKFDPNSSTTYFDVRREVPRSQKPEISSRFRHLLGPLYTSDPELISYLDKADLNEFTAVSLSAVLRGYSAFVNQHFALHSREEVRDRIVKSLEGVEKARKLELSLFLEMQENLTKQNRRLEREKFFNERRIVALSEDVPSKDKIDSLIEQNNLSRMPFLPKKKEDLLQFQLQMFNVASLIREEILSFYNSIENRENLWISLLNIPRKHVQEFFSPFNSTIEQRESLRNELILELMPLSSEELLAGYIYSKFPAESISKIQLLRNETSKFETIVLNYLKTMNSELYYWFKSFANFEHAKEAIDDIDMIYFKKDSTIFSKSQKDFIYIGKDDENSLYLPRIQQMLVWATEYRNEIINWVSNMVSLIYEKSVGENEREIAEDIHSFIVRVSKQPEVFTFTFSGLRYWSSNDIGVSNVQPINYVVEFKLVEGTVEELSKAIREALLHKIDSESDEVYVNLTPTVVFDSVSVKIESREALSKIFKRPRGFTEEISTKLFNVLAETIHQKNSVEKNLVPAVHGWVKPIAFENEETTNCLLSAMHEIAEKNGVVLNAMEIYNIKSGWAINVCISHNWPVYIASCPSYQPVFPLPESWTLYVLPYHAFAIESERLKKEFSEKRESKPYVFGKPRDIDYGYELFNNSICFDVEAYAVEEEVQEVYLLTWWGRIDGEESFGKLSTTRDLPLTGIQIMQMFIEYILYIASKPERFGKTLYVYSYNGPKYEFRYLIRPLSNRVEEILSFGNISSSKGLSCLNNALVFRDPKFLFGGGSLKVNSESFNPPEMKKIDLEKLDPPVFLPECFEDYERNREIIDEYCLADSKAAMTLVYSFFKHMEEILKEISPELEVDVREFTNDWTAPQVAIHLLESVFCKGYNIKAENDLDYLIPEQKSNFGGMVGGCYAHFGRRVASCDLCSAYPAAMTRKLPFSRISSWEPIDEGEHANIFFKKSEQMLTLYECSHIKYADHQMPFIPIRGKEALSYPTEIKENVYVWGITLNCLVRNGGEVELVRRVRYSSKDSGWPEKRDKKGREPKEVHGFRNFNKSLYKLRREYKDLYKKDPVQNAKYVVLEKLVKLFLNSSYGKFNQRKFDGKTVLGTLEEEMNLEYINLEHHAGFAVATTPNNQHSNSGNLVRLSSYITSLVRVELAEAIEIIGKQNVVYFDTDSIYFFKEQLPLLAHKITKTGELGMFEKEKFEFSEGIILGPKMRFFKTCLKNDQEFISISSKTKGISFDDEKQQPELEHLYQTVKEKILENEEIGAKAGVKHEVYRIPIARRWVWDKMKTGNVIQKYEKVINFYQRKKRIERNYMEHINWEEYKEL